MNDAEVEWLPDEWVPRFAGAVLLLVGVHFVAEAALGRVHAVEGSLSRAYALAAAVLFLSVGAALVRTGALADRRLEWAAAALSVVVLAVVAAAHLA